MKLISYSITSYFKALGLAVFAIAGLSSCAPKDPNSPGTEFMPDMYRSPSLEYYTPQEINGKLVYASEFKPVEGTVSQEVMPYPYPNTAEGYEAAGTYLKNPLANNEANLKDGEALYKNFCVHCHGEAGAGDGKVAAKLPGAPPAYDGPLKMLPEGKIFHTMHYGKGLMGSHASQLSQTERWKLVLYVQKLQGPKVEAVAADSTAKEVAKPAEKK